MTAQLLATNRQTSSRNNPSPSFIPQANLVVRRAPMMMYTSSELDGIALQFGKELRALLLEGTESGELIAYVNYAQGG